ncbi:Peroxisome assembly protein 12 [Golovinomyces cichoracearum]|uniref:Peroxisome assembly protein 12 n=1 Tax=Golovinomyces cichoracearum TaxID=62708 RepID=A0A420HNE6_9PEZI|nr:Peroxisome assembly protein 12 [Golovinomyces cichoracearum]
MEFVPILHSKFDNQKPSLFELTSEAQLASLLPPTLRYLLAIATHRNPRYLLRILNYFDELHALLMVTVEYHYIKIYGGGFTENFYGLKREKVPTVGDIPRASSTAPSQIREILALTNTDICKNIAVMVGIPYLKRKLDESFEINTSRTLLGANYTREPPNPNLSQKLTYYYRWFLQKFYPSLNAAYHFSLLFFHILYLFDNSRYHSPFLWLIRTRIRRLTDVDHKAIATSSDSQLKSNSRIFSANWAICILKKLLPASIVALKFLEWWHASDFSSQLSKKNAENFELFPPAHDEFQPKTMGSEKFASKKLVDGTKKKSDDMSLITDETPLGSRSLLPIFTVPSAQEENSCPICLREIMTATACQTGFVFCYTCIHRWLEGNHEKQVEFMIGNQGKWESGKGRCAVSGRRVLGGTESLRRLMI